MLANRSRGIVMVFTAGVLYSSAGLFTRALHVDTWTIVAWRALSTVVFTLAWMGVTQGRGMLRSFAFSAREWFRVPLMAVGGICYIFALKVTTVADVMVVYATMPFVTAGVAWFWGRELPSRRLLTASVVALGGVAIMVAGGAGDGQRLLGIGLTLCMNIVFAMTLVGAQRTPGSTTALYATGTALNAIVAFSLAPVEPVGAMDVALMISFGLLTGFAMALFMGGARLIPPAEVGLIGISDVVIGPALVWVGFAEIPSTGAAIGGTVVVAALVWHLWPDLPGGGRSRRIEPERLGADALPAGRGVCAPCADGH